MPKCPKCGKEINGLYYGAAEINRYWFTIEEGKANYSIDDSWTEYSEYDCPECGAPLFTDEEEAEKFLRGG